MSRRRLRRFSRPVYPFQINGPEGKVIEQDNFGLKEAKSFVEDVDDHDSSTDNEFVLSLRDYT